MGTLYLVARYEAAQRLIDSGLIVGVVVLLSLLVSGLVSAWLGRKLTTPILDVTDAAHHVMERRDFSVRVKKTTRILVADDVVDSMESMALALQILGHEVRTATDGTSALDTAVAFQPDVAILDIGMPGLSGYALATRIRQHDWGRRVLLIALTGWGQRDDVNQGHASGFNHHMTSPADFHATKRLIDEFRVARGGAPDPTAAGV